MTESSSNSTLREIFVSRKNLSQILPHIIQHLSKATFVSMDTEFSGMGNDRGILASNIEERYIALKKVVETHSLFQLGISIFSAISSDTEENPKEEALKAEVKETSVQTENDSESTQDFYALLPSSFAALAEQVEDTPPAETKRKKRESYHVETFTFLLLNTEDFVVTPSSMTFLVDHGFDFNELFKNGIPFTPKGATPANPLNSSKVTSQTDLNLFNELLQIWNKILAIKKPIALHNGLLDLMFLYHTFCDKLPDKVTTFQARAAELFTRLLDTKYIHENWLCQTPSFLEYAYKKAVRRNLRSEAKGKRHLTLKSLLMVDSSRPFSLPVSESTNTEYKVALCVGFAKYGYCKVPDCTLSHCVDQILDEEERNAKAAKMNKKKKRQRSSSSMFNLGQKTDLPEPKKRKQDGTDEDHAAQSHVINTTDGENKPVNPNEAERCTEANEELQAPELISSSIEPQIDNRPRTDSHGAGVDAFATGYLLASYRLRDDFDENKWKGKLYLMGKSMPLLIVKSQYA